MKEEKKDSMIVLSPWNENIKSLESEFADKEQKIDVAEGDIYKDIQEVWVEAISTAIPGAISRVIAEAEIGNAEESNQQVEDEWTKYSNKWQSNKSKICYQLKDVLEMEIEELWQLMMKQSRLRKMTAGGVISQNLKLIEERKMNQKTTDIQQQQRCKAFGQLQTKVWDPGGFFINT